jgi:alpha-ketoglutarate-dependent 2,4-dichlorophenoxyacetate dioxygenase
VRVHPGSGRKVLYIGAHARRVIGMPTPAGRILLRDLLEHATQQEFVYRHAWRPGDLVLWDNRSVMHRGCRYDLSQVRDMRRTTVLDLDSINERDCGETAEGA